MCLVTSRRQRWLAVWQSANCATERIQDIYKHSLRAQNKQSAATCSAAPCRPSSAAVAFGVCRDLGVDSPLGRYLGALSQREGAGRCQMTNSIFSSSVFQVERKRWPDSLRNGLRQNFSGRSKGKSCCAITLPLVCLRRLRCKWHKNKPLSCAHLL